MADALPVLPWWGPEVTPASLWAAVEAARRQLEGHPAMPLFGRQTVLAGVVMLNKLEGTLPAGFDELAAYQLLLEQADLLEATADSEPDGEPDAAAHWPAEGGTWGTQQQLLQSLKAVKYLCWPLRAPLSVHSICTAHKILMWGAKEEDGTLLPAGQLRTAAAHSGTGYVYPQAAEIPAKLQQIVDDFNAAVSSGNADPVGLAADLLYRFVTLHPFTNGNGRMCRLLAAYAARSAGVPFMLHLDSARSKVRQHYLQVLCHADRHQRDTARLRSFILECLNKQWQDALAYAGGFLQPRLLLLQPG